MLTNTINKPDFSIVMPVFMASSFVVETIDRLDSFLRKKKVTYEIIVVVDGIVDDSLDTIREIYKHNQQIRIFSYTINKGKGYAVRYGLSKAYGLFIGFIDAGTDISISSLNYMINSITYDQKDFDVWVADKTIEGSTIQVNRVRSITSNCFRLMIFILFGNKLGDTQTGLKIMKKSVYDNIKTRLTINRFAFDVELLLVIINMKYRIKRCLVHLSPQIDQKSTVSMLDVFNMAYVVILLSLKSRVQKFRKKFTQIYIHKNRFISYLSTHTSFVANRLSIFILKR